MVDVDRFKHFNDVSGHLAGDACLRRVARALEESVRVGDFVARYGGEEFAILFETCEYDALVVGERACGAVRGASLAAADGVAVTISVGIATYAPGDDALRLVERADAALYRAKETGRDRVEIADERRAIAPRGVCARRQAASPSALRGWRFRRIAAPCDSRLGGYLAAMNRRSMVTAAAKVALAAPLVSLSPLALPSRAEAADVSAADRAFVAMVSQGGMFEVEASKLAVRSATARDVVDQSATEVHDHALVGAKLKAIAASLGLSFPTELDATFTADLETLRSASPGKAFDDASIEQMDAVHAADVRAFAKEAASGTNPALVAVAAETVLVVRRHIGALHAVPLPTK